MKNQKFNSSEWNTMLARQKLRYQSERRRESGYDYFEARLYDSDFGRFLQYDPLASDPMQLDKSPYAYTWNNPINLTDPDGKRPWQPIGEGQWQAEPGDGAESLAKDAGISRKQAYGYLAQQGMGTYVDKNGVRKSDVNPGDIVNLPVNKFDGTDEGEVSRFENKIEELEEQKESQTADLKKNEEWFGEMHKGPQGASPDPSTGAKLGYAINALIFEKKVDKLKEDTSKAGEQIRAYQDSLKNEKGK